MLTFPIHAEPEHLEHLDRTDVQMLSFASHQPPPEHLEEFPPFRGNRFHMRKMRQVLT